MRATRGPGSRPLAFPLALLVGAATQAAVVAALAATSDEYPGVAAGLGVLIAVLTGLLAGPAAGAIVALIGGAGFVVFIAEDRLRGWVAVALWIAAAAAAGIVADRYRRAARDRDVAHASERRAREAAESESERLERLQRLTGRLTTAVTVEEVAEVLVDTVVGSFGAAAAGLALLSADGTELHAVASRGYPSELVEQWRTMPSNTPVILADAIASRSVVSVDSADEALGRYPLLRTLGPTYPLGGQAAAPVLVGDVILGVIGVNFRGMRPFRAEDASLLFAIGLQCGQALERTRLFDAERRARERATQLRELASALAAAGTPEEIARLANDLVFPMLGARSGAIGIVTSDAQALELVAAPGFAGRVSGPFGRIALTTASPEAEAVRAEEPLFLGSMVEVKDRFDELAEARQLMGFGAWACVPLKVGPAVVGVLSVDYEGQESFDERQRVELRAVADQVALALERSLLQHAREQARRLSARVERVVAVSGALSPGLGIAEVARAIVSEAAEALEAAAGGICLATADGEWLEFVARIGPMEDLVARLRSDEPGAVTDAYQTGASVLFERAEDRPDAEALAAQLGEPLVGVIVVPISAAGRRIGAMGLRFERERSLSPDELGFVRDLAEQADQALERARLFEAEQRALRRAARLQDVTARLARAVTTDDASRAILRGATGGVSADAAAIALASDDGRVLRVTPGLMTGGTLRLQPPQQISTGDRSALAQVYRNGRALWVPSAERWKQQFEDGFALQHDLGRCLYAVPVVAKGEAIGALAVYFKKERPEPTPEDVDLIRSFAQQAGIALERARTYEAEHEAAMTLQRNLMPEGMDFGAHVDADGRYLPATKGVHVGGDWYDIVDRPDGAVAFAVGDIAGHGLQAAAAMGQVRAAWRALALSMTEPSLVLGGLDRFAAGVEGAFFSTILTMRLDPSTNELRYASAGHPPALVIEPDGTARFLDDARSVPLGLPFDLPRPQARETLAPGAVLVLYTDGLVERRDEPLDRGLERLADTAARVGARPLAEISDTLVELVADDRHDDVALLTIGPRLPTDVFRRTFPAEAQELASMREELRTWLERSGVPAETREDIVLACTEAAANAIEHAYIGRAGQVQVSAESENGWIEVAVSDEGRWRDPRPDDVRGRGLELVRSLVGDIHIERGERGTTVRMRVGTP